jgi:hypothetical protein
MVDGSQGKTVAGLTLGRNKQAGVESTGLFSSFFL